MDQHPISMVDLQNKMVLEMCYGQQFPDPMNPENHVLSMLC